MRRMVVRKEARFVGYKFNIYGYRHLEPISCIQACNKILVAVIIMPMQRVFVV